MKMTAEEAKAKARELIAKGTGTQDVVAACPVRLGDLMDLLAERGQIPIRRTLGFTAGRI